MTRIGLAAGLLLWPAVTLAQSGISIETIPLPDDDEDPIIETRPTPDVAQPTAEPGERAAGAVLRALDKVSGATTDIELSTGQQGQMFALEVVLSECRYPAGNPAGDAYAFLTIRAPADREALFSGWMVASSPALSALDHARYDVWVLRCITS